MDVDPYRLAYNVLHHNWKKFGIPAEDIPPPKTEEVDSLNPIIPPLSNTVILFQIASRKDLKLFLDKECPTAHDLTGVCTRFKYIMQQVLPAGAVWVGSPKKGLHEDTTSEDVSPDTTEEYLSEDTIDEDLPEDAATKNLQKDATKEDLPGYKIHFGDIPGIIAYSLAVCTELVLYERENENNKDYMKTMPDIWKNYFDENLKSHCKKARYTQAHLRDYCDGIRCPEKYLNKFIAENKNEYDDISEKFHEYAGKYLAVESPEHTKVITEEKKFSKGLSFLKIKEKYAAIKDVCKCMKGLPSDEIPLLADVSPGSSSSSATTPSS